MRKFKLAGCLVLLGGLYAGSVFADQTYQVTITNVTRGISFTPILAITHKAGSPLFELGSPASDELAAIAEGGDTTPFKNKLLASGMAMDATSSAGLLAPGASVSLTLTGNDDFDYVTVASMLLPTNDGFIAVNGMKLPDGNKKVMVYSPAYDAGSENNDESCASIPGPHCGGEAFSAGQGEGFVHIHAGIKGIADLDAAKYDWRNPVAKISITRVKN